MFDHSLIKVKSEQLSEISNILKKEFFGLDDVIDRIIPAVNAWYTFPEMITRPVIINLWGLTGVGKTHLVRRLTELLGFNNRFLEVQMDGVAGSSNHSAKNISTLLGDSSIEQGQPGIILLDEFQRFRTIDILGSDVKIERFQDVWMLLSDGKFAADSTIFNEIEMLLASAAYYDDQRDTSPESDIPDINTPVLPVKPKKFSIYPYEARRYKKVLQLSESLQDIMTWGADQLERALIAARESTFACQMDYTKTLIFISGNLDEAFDAADSVNDSDTDADIFYQRSLKVGVHQIKTALQSRFKPEQISRLGNNHVIYPSISKKAYQQLIHRTCQEYIDSMVKLTGIKLFLQPSAETVIYDNAVYPAQGTRPVFSSIHSIFSDALVQVCFWAIQHKLTDIDMTIDSNKFVLIATSDEMNLEVSIILDVDMQKKKTSPEFITTVAVHEAGHALVGAILKNLAPSEIKINPASFKGGYVIPGEIEALSTIMSKSDIRSNIAMLWAGRAAESLVFGPMHVSAGATSDILKATMYASNYVRQYAMDGVLGTEITQHPGHIPTGLEPNSSSNEAIRQILNEEYANAVQVLTEHKHLFIRLVDALLSGQVLTPLDFEKMFPEIKFIQTSPRVEDWKRFKGNI